MKWKILISILILMVITVYLCYAQSSDQEKIQELDAGYVIKSKDVLSVKFYRHKDLDQEQIEVTPTGTIFMPLIGEVKASGITTSELERKLISIYSKDYLKNPYITVSVLSRRYYVLGEVKSPGAYPLVGNVTVLTAITQAGGFTDYAAKNNVKVIRNVGNSKKSIAVNVDKIIKSGDTSGDVMLQAGDVVNVPQSMF